MFSPFEEIHLNLTYKPNLIDTDDITARFLFCSEPRGGVKDPICVLNASLKKAEVRKLLFSLNNQLVIYFNQLERETDTYSEFLSGLRE